MELLRKNLIGSWVFLKFAVAEENRYLAATHVKSVDGSARLSKLHYRAKVVVWLRSSLEKSRELFCPIAAPWRHSWPFCLFFYFPLTLFTLTHIKLLQRFSKTKRFFSYRRKSFFLCLSSGYFSLFQNNVMKRLMRDSVLMI